MDDEIAHAHAELRRKLLAQLQLEGSQSKTEAVAAIRELGSRYPLCIEVALSVAALDFFSGGATQGLAAAKKMLDRKDDFYSVSCLNAVSGSRLRGLVSARPKLAATDYIRFLFPFYYLREQYENRGFFYSWIMSEFKKRKANKQYNELYLLRNMTWSLTRGLASQARKAEIMKYVEMMDYAIVEILKQRLARRSTARPRAVNKIVICCGLLKHDDRSLHAKLVLDYANNLCAAYPSIDVVIVVSNELPFKWVGDSFRMNYTSEAYRKRLAILANEIVNDDVGLRARIRFFPLAHGSWQDLWNPIRAIIEYDPDVIMHFGSKYWNESWFTRKVLFDTYPTAYFFSQMNNVVDLDNDIYLARNRYPLRGTYDESRVRIAPPAIRSSVIFESARFATKERRVSEPKGIGNQITIVTALIGPRMREIFSRYTPSLRRQMMQLLDVGAAKWVWVGPSSADELYSLDPAFRKKHDDGKLEILSFAEDLEMLYGSCDFMLHLPNFTGGGGGVLLALHARLPVLCFGDTDMSTYVLPECVFEPGDVNGCFARAKELILAPEQLPSLGRRCAEYAASIDTATLARLTYDGLVDALGIFRSRAESVSRSSTG